MVEKIKAWLYGIKPDKLLHFIAGMLLAQLIFKFCACCMPLWWSMLVAVATTAIVAGVKELIDVKYGVPSWADWLWSMAGCCVGLIIMVL